MEEEPLSNRAFDPETAEFVNNLFEQLQSEPDLLDAWFDRLPAELSFVLRQLPHDEQLLKPFLRSAAPLMLKEQKYGSPLNDGDKIDLFLDIMAKPECFEWIVRAILGKEPEDADESSAPAWLENTRAGMHALELQEFEQARQLLTKALEESDKIAPNSLWSFAIMRALVAACAGTGRLEEAEPLALRWIASGEKKLGRWHPDLAYPYSILAHVKELQNDRSKAEELHHQAVQIVERSKGENHPDLIPCLDSMAFFYSRQEEYEQAGQIFRRIMSIQSTNPDVGEDELEEYLEVLLEIDLRLKTYASAEDYARRLLELRKRQGLTDSPHSAITMGLLATCLLARGKNAESSVLFERAIELLGEVAAEDNERVAFVFSAFIDELRNQGRQYEAQECQWLSRRTVYETMEFNSQGCEIRARGIPIVVSAGVVYRLCQPLQRNADSCGFFTESDDEIHAHIHARLIKHLQDFFEPVDFLRVLTDIDSLQDEFCCLIQKGFAEEGIELEFAFSSFADSVGFLEVLRQVNDAEDLPMSEGAQEFRQALEKAAEFPDSDILAFVQSRYDDFLDRHDVPGEEN